MERFDQSAGWADRMVVINDDAVARGRAAMIGSRCRRARDGMNTRRTEGEAFERLTLRGIADIRDPPKFYERLVQTPSYGGDMQDRGYPRVVLPAPGTVRWSARRKRAVLMALDLGEISEEEVCRRYAMHPDELSAWRRGEVYMLPANRRRRPTS
jgi:hypothetical protein